MSESKHTPGPWRSHEDFEFEINSEDGLPVCTVECLGCHPSTIGGENTARARANRDLIAAAPELLEALRDLRDRIYRDFEEVPVHVLSRADAAIQAATGGSE